MGILSRLDVPVIYGSLRDRWFVVLKPPGFFGPAWPHHPSVESTLQPFCDGRDLFFPIRPEKDAQGLVIVATDEAMRKCFQDLVRQRLVRSTFRVLADVTPPTPGCPAAVNPTALPFTSCERLATRHLLGSLRTSTGGLRAKGALRSRMATRPLRFSDGRDSLQEEGAESELINEVVSSAATSAGAWSTQKELLAGLQGKAVPKPLKGKLGRSVLSHSLSPQSALWEAPVALTEFELLSGPLACPSPCPSRPSMQTAVFSARPCTSAPHQVRVHFVEAGCPVMYDTYYHPLYNYTVRRKHFHEEAGEAPPAVSQGCLGLQLCTLELPDPFRPSRLLRINLKSWPEEWESVHPSGQLHEEDGSERERFLS